MRCICIEYDVRFYRPEPIDFTWFRPELFSVKIGNVENTKKMHVITRNLNQNKVEWILKDEYILWHLESGGQ